MAYNLAFEVPSTDIAYEEAESRRISRAAKLSRDNRVPAPCKVAHPTLTIGRRTPIKCETPMPHGEGEHWNSYAMRTW